MLSSVKEGNIVTHFPHFTHERVYMLEFWKELRLPIELRRWQSTVDQMLLGVDTGKRMYLMVDQSVVQAGQPQRRPGVHIDGYWSAGLSMHNGGGGRHTPRHIPVEPVHTPGRSPFHSAATERWEDATFEEPEAIILASNIQGCRGFVGEFNGPIHDGGDASEVDLSSLAEVQLEAHQTYIGNVSFLHESLPFPEACKRTLVRINAPGWQ
jgi:hypothetical protein